jgi:hypothetical protein
VITARNARWIGATIVFIGLTLQAGFYWSSDVLAGMVG